MKLARLPFVLVGLARAMVVALAQESKLGFEPRKLVIPNENDFPLAFINDLKKVEGTLLVAPVQAQFCEIAVEPIPNRSLMGGSLNRQYGWVWKDEDSGVHLTLTPSGSIFVARAVLKEADYSEYVSWLQQDPMARQIGYSTPLVQAATLLLMGRVDEAKAINLPYGGSNGFGPGLGREPSIVNDLVLMRRMDYVNALSSRQYAGAKKIAEMLDFAKPETSLTQYQGYFDDISSKEMVSEAARLMRGKPANNSGLGELTKQKEYEQAIESLAWESSDVSKISSYGEEIVPLLISRFITDDRISPFSSFSYSAAIPTVRASIYVHLQRIWTTMPLWTNRTQLTVSEYADLLDSEWKMQQGMGVTDRMVRAIVASEGESIGRVWQWFYEEIGSTDRLPYVPGKTYKRYEDISLEGRKDIVELASRLIEKDVRDPIQGGANYDVRTRVALLAAAVDQKNTLGILRQLSSQLVAHTLNSHSFDAMTQIGGVTAQRIVLGDKKAALVDYEAAAREARWSNYNIQNALLPSILFPKDKDVQAATSRILEMAGKVSVNRQNFGELYPMSRLNSSTAFEAPAVRDFIIKQLRSNEVIGELRFKANGSQLRSELFIDGVARYTWFTDDKVTESHLPPSRNMELGEFYLVQLSSQMLGKKMSLLMSKDQRLQNRDEAIQNIKEGNFVVRNENDLWPIWMPVHK